MPGIVVQVFSGRIALPSWTLTKCSLNISRLINRTQTSPSFWHEDGRVSKPFINISAVYVIDIWENRTVTEQYMK